MSPPLVLICLASAWGATGFMDRLLPVRLAQGLCVAMLAAAAYYNLSYTFVQYPRESQNRADTRALLLVTRVCAGSGSEADHALLMDQEQAYLRVLVRLQCPVEHRRLVSESRQERQ